MKLTARRQADLYAKPLGGDPSGVIAGYDELAKGLADLWPAVAQRGLAVAGQDLAVARQSHAAILKRLGSEMA